jgi:DNA-binding NarL/FixJ family response regulator
MESSDTGARLTSRMKRLVIVADNSLIVEAIQSGLRHSGEFNLLGHADPRRTSARTIVGVQPDVILFDDMDRSEQVVELIREVKAEDERIAAIVLSIHMDPVWLQRAFDAGATAAISKASQPGVLATLVRETLNGHILHRLPGSRPPGRQQLSSLVTEALPLTGRELEILQLVAAGSTNGEVARSLWVTEPTVKFHLRNIYRKLDVANRTEASHFAHVNGLVGIPEMPSGLTAVSSGTSAA